MIEAKDLAHLASLAQLRLGAEESAALRGDMESIIALMDSMRALELPETDENPPGAPLAALREDAAFAEAAPALFLEQAPDGGGGGGFAIPLMMD